MFRTLRTVLLMAAGLAVLVRLLDAWSEPRLAPTPPRPPTPPAPAGPGPEGVGGAFAVSGDAGGDGRVTWTPVAFGEPLRTAPTGWGREDGQAWPAGTIVLEVTEAVNCTPDDVAVEFATGRAPCAEGFALRVACAGPGPFAARGTYRVA